MERRKAHIPIPHLPPTFLSWVWTHSETGCIQCRPQHQNTQVESFSSGWGNTYLLLCQLPMSLITNYFWVQWRTTASLWGYRECEGTCTQSKGHMCALTVKWPHYRYTGETYSRFIDLITYADRSLLTFANTNDFTGDDKIYSDILLLLTKALTPSHCLQQCPCLKETLKVIPTVYPKGTPQLEERKSTQNAGSSIEDRNFSEMFVNNLCANIPP